MRSHRGLLAATAALAVSGAVAGVGVAGAAEDEANVTITALDATWNTPNVRIAPGETVTWNTGVHPTHNVKATNDVAADPDWKSYLQPGPGPYDMAAADTNYTRAFPEEGVYTFRCEIHPGTMTGTITVGDEPAESPSPDPTVSATPTPRPTPQPGGDDHTNTPAPGGAAKDTVKPHISRITVKALRRAARVRFRVSEPASVTIRVKRRGKSKVLRSVKVQAPAGTRTVTVRSTRLKKGRYTVELSARDAMGNRSSLARKSLRLRR